MLKKSNKKSNNLEWNLNSLQRKKNFLYFSKFMRDLVINVYDLLFYYFIKNMFNFINFMKIRTVNEFLFKCKFIDTLKYFFFLKKKKSFFMFSKSNNFFIVCFYYIFMKLVYLRLKIKEKTFFKNFFIKKKREIFFFYNFFFFFNKEKLFDLLTFLNLRKIKSNYKVTKFFLKKNVIKQYFFNFFFQNYKICSNINLFKNFYYVNKNLKLKLNKSFLFFKIYIYN